MAVTSFGKRRHRYQNGQGPTTTTLFLPGYPGKHPARRTLTTCYVVKDGNLIGIKSNISRNYSLIRPV